MKGPHVTRFVEFLALQDGTPKSMHEVATGLLEKMRWMLLNQEVLTTMGLLG